MTTAFYVHPDDVRDGRAVLRGDEARHASRVLRARAGDELAAVDGAGGWYRVVLDHVDRQNAAGHIVETRRDVGEPPYHLTLAVGVIKNRNRFETMLEKAVELGVRAIVPLLTARTEKERIREQRSENILIAAMKQCGRSRLVELHPPMPLEEILAEKAFDLSLCCHESARPDDHLLRVLGGVDRPERIAVLVGPEGGFSEAEIEVAEREGCRIVSLGTRRLRAETAALCAAAAVGLTYDSA